MADLLFGPSHRHKIFAAAAAFALGSAGCTSGSGPTGTTPGLTGTTAWADGVCVEVVDLRTALGDVGDGLTLNPLEGSTSLEEARERIDAQVADVQVAIDDLRVQIRSAPDDPTSQEAEAALDDALAAIEDNQQTALERAQAALSAGSLPEAIAAAGGALGAVSGAMGAVGDLVRTATGEGSGASAEVRAAFADAPACQALTG